MSFVVPGITHCEEHGNIIGLGYVCGECEAERNKKRIITNSEKMETMDIEDKAIFLHDFYTTHTHITVNDFKEWLSAEYKEPIKLTIEEYIILKNIDMGYNYIARNKNGDLFLFKLRPAKQISNEEENNFWIAYNPGNEACFDLYNHLFKFITWEDKEAYDIMKLLKGVNYELLYK